MHCTQSNKNTITNFLYVIQAGRFLKYINVRMKIKPIRTSNYTEKEFTYNYSITGKKINEILINSNHE